MGSRSSPCGRGDYVSSSFKETLNFWRRWIGQSTYDGRWREAVNRSALALKLLSSVGGLRVQTRVVVKISWRPGETKIHADRNGTRE